CGTMSHHQDVGGSAPGSTAPNAVDLHAEGIRIPLLKLADAEHGLNPTLIALLLANVRVPVSFRGDLEAQLAACRTGVRRVQEVCREYGRTTLLAGVDALQDYAERMTRSVIERIPDGTYEFHDFLDDDGVVPEPIRIQVKVTVRGSGIHFDFAGTALTGSAVPNNDGCYRPVSVSLPPGTIVNPNYPAPVAARAITFKRIV